MNNFLGWTKEKMGRSTHKAILLRSIARTEKTYPTHKPDGTVFNDPQGINEVRIYQAVAAHYFNPNEKLWKYKKNETYELHIENDSFLKNEAKIQFINAETGAPIAFEEKLTVTYPPNVLNRLLSTEHIKSAVNAARGMNTGILMLGLCLGFGVVLGLLLGMNMDGITQVVTGAAPTPTPTPPIYYVKPIP